MAVPFSPEEVRVFSFSGIYNEETFYHRLPKATGSLVFSDYSHLPGTNGYLSPEAESVLTAALESVPLRGVRFIDSGNTHYMTKLLAGRIRDQYALVLFDHHPDLQSPAFGPILSCGSWLRFLLQESAFPDPVILAGVSEVLAAEAFDDDNLHWMPDEAHAGVKTCSFCNRTLFLVPEDVLTSDTLTALLPPSLPVYLSLDKDIVSVRDIRTNWDQGTLSAKSLYPLLRAVRDARTVFAVDICGEYAFPPDNPTDVTRNDEMNAKLLDIFTGCG